MKHTYLLLATLTTTLAGSDLTYPPRKGLRTLKQELTQALEEQEEIPAYAQLFASILKEIPLVPNEHATITDLMARCLKGQEPKISPLAYVALRGASLFGFETLNTTSRKGLDALLQQNPCVRPLQITPQSQKAHLFTTPFYDALTNYPSSSHSLTAEVLLGALEEVLQLKQSVDQKKLTTGLVDIPVLYLQWQLPHLKKDYKRALMLPLVFPPFAVVLLKKYPFLADQRLNREGCSLYNNDCSSTSITLKECTALVGQEHPYLDINTNKTEELWAAY